MRGLEAGKDQGGFLFHFFIFDIYLYEAKSSCFRFVGQTIQARSITSNYGDMYFQIIVHNNRNEPVRNHDYCRCGDEHNYATRTGIIYDKIMDVS